MYMEINPSLARQGIRNGVLAAAYIVVMALLLSHAPQFDQKHEWLIAAMMLTLFVVSALITGSLVLWSPLKMLSEGERKEAGMLLCVTAGTLFVILVLLLLAVFLF